MLTPTLGRALAGGVGVGSLMEELEKGMKELRGFVGPWKEQQCQQARPPGAPRDWTINQRIHNQGGTHGAPKYVAEYGLVGHQ